MIVRVFFTLWIILLLPAIAHASQPEILALADDFYPVQYKENNTIVGPATALVKRVLTEAKVPYSIAMQPWARTYNTALHKPNILIYSIVRTAEREKLFHWIGPVIKVNYFLYGLEQVKINANTPLNELNKYRIAAVRQTASALFFAEHKIKSVRLIGDANQAIKMLLNNRVDLIPGIKGIFEKNCQRQHFRCEQIKPLYKLEKPSTEFYLALSKKTDKALVKKIKQAYQTIAVDPAIIEQQIKEIN